MEPGRGSSGSVVGLPPGPPCKLGVEAIGEMVTRHLRRDHAGARRERAMLLGRRAIDRLACQRRGIGAVDGGLL